MRKSADKSKRSVAAHPANVNPSECDLFVQLCAECLARLTGSWGHMFERCVREDATLAGLCSIQPSLWLDIVHVTGRLDAAQMARLLVYVQWFFECYRANGVRTIDNGGHGVDEMDIEIGDNGASGGNNDDSASGCNSSSKGSANGGCEGNALGVWIVSCGEGGGRMMGGGFGECAGVVGCECDW